MENEKNKENMQLKKGPTQEVLEISSTGYGFESVTEPVKESDDPNPSCGGL